jgi:hypothetical protein
MSLDAYVFINHAAGTPQCEVRRTGVPADLDDQNFSYLDLLLRGAGEATVPVIGDAAFRLVGGELERVMPDVEVLCQVHQIADPTEPHAATVDDYFVDGGSLI